jgi:transaldolase
MEIFLDSANLSEIQKWTDMGIIDGVTTNPSIMLKDGAYNIETRAKEIAKLIAPNPLSVEVTTNDLAEMVSQAKKFDSWAQNIAIKIPQINQDGVPCYGVIKQLEEAGIMVNATVALSIGQVMLLSAKAGATYISIFAGRISDEGGDSAAVIANSADWLEHWDYKSKIIVGSIRSVGDVISAALAGAHIVTTPPAMLAKMADHQYTRETVKQFVTDAKKAMDMLDEGR